MRLTGSSGRLVGHQAQFPIDPDASSQDRLRQQAMFQTGPSAVREELPSQHLAAASPSGDPAMQAFFKSNSSMADHEALLQKHDDSLEDGLADEGERLRMEGTGSNLFKNTLL